MSALILTLQILVAILSLLMILLVLLHKGKGGGVSDMFGGGMSSSAASSGVAARNLDRISIATALIWIILIITLGVLVKFGFA
ncbi:preprotein translocase subunit SecG [Boudabousia tangfeifanii]|uniref:Protein-export membrane protein SecG n=1 Tax=Boudabousia tangfeifanii TaxID=1912795 RepID=A0A1D9MK54_9ACTO|nr:preprotein translocase subunit SecG [Boudabousia tangfeifanii]AOZ72598.1 preprotein translocase subunit SecG [Boudabousia tangfeifanii]